MKMVIANPVVDPREIDEAVTALVNESHQDDFREISTWMLKTGCGERGAKERLIKEISERVSKELSRGLIQVTVQGLEEETEIRAKIEKEPGPIYPHIDFVVKSGALDLWTATYWFRVRSRVVLDNLSVKMKKGEIAGISSGTLQAYVTLGYCGHVRENPQPFTLFKDRKVLDVELEKVVSFE